VQDPWHEAVVPLRTHAWLVQPTAVPHDPPGLQVWTAALPEHCVAPGAQDPVHTPPEHAAALQSTGEPQVPVPLHVSTPFPLHRVDPGAHDPVHAPPTHAVFPQGEDAPHVPVELQVETPLTDPPSAPVAHSVAPGEHTPAHEAVPTGPTHAWLVQAAAVPQAPAAVHVWREALPEHCVWPGAQEPPHDAVPATTRHVVFAQADGAVQAPAPVHVDTALIEPPSAPGAHSLVPGVHTPWQLASVLPASGLLSVTQA
jgi:hypothetical protein